MNRAPLALELARPGTLGLATNGDAQSQKYVDVAAELGMQSGAIFESRRRPENMPTSLQTTSSSARTAANLQPNDQMQAHHLIPANVWGKLAPITRLASQAGWQQDSPDNLIPLPANEATQAKMEAEGLTLPMHSSSHTNYDGRTTGEIVKGILKSGVKSVSDLSPAQACAIYKNVEREMEKLIIERTWMPTLY